MDYSLSLGSNLGDRVSHLSDALDFLASRGRLRNVSAVYETTPLDMREAGADFLNMAVILSADMAPISLLRRIKIHENSRGRDLQRSHHRPRAIDIDILLAGELIEDRDGLKLPHPAMHLRAFVLRPLAEIAPDLRHPVLGKTIACLLRDLPDELRDKHMIRLGEIDTLKKDP